jgi:hypothetical protein
VVDFLGEDKPEPFFFGSKENETEVKSDAVAPVERVKPKVSLLDTKIKSGPIVISRKAIKVRYDLFEDEDEVRQTKATKAAELKSLLFKPKP